MSALDNSTHHIDADPEPATVDSSTAASAPVPRRARGRPKKPTHTKVLFDAGVHGSTIAAIKVIPRNRYNAVRDEVIARVDRDKAVRGSHKVVFGAISREIWWKDGVCLRSNAWLAKECGTSTRNAELAIEALRDAGLVSRRQRKTKAGAPRSAETTIPLFAQVWREMQAHPTAEGVPYGKSEGVPNENVVPHEESNFRSVGTEPECGQPSVPFKEKNKDITPSPAAPPKVPHDSASREVPAAPAHMEEDDRPWHALHLLGWVEDGRTASVYFGDTSPITDDIEAEVAGAFPDDAALREMILDACGGRLGRSLRTEGGMYAVRRLASGIMAHAREIAPDGAPVTPHWAMNVITQAMRVRFGNRTDQWLNSYAVVGKRLAGEMYTGCIVPDYTRGYEPQPVTEEGLAAGKGGDALRIVLKAGGWKVLAPQLQIDPDALLAFLDLEAAEHRRRRTEVLEAVVDVLRRAAATGWSVGGQPNKEVGAWAAFRGILAREQRAPTAAPPQQAAPTPEQSQTRPRDPIPAALKEADGLGILAPDLTQFGGQELRTFVAEQVAQYQCTANEILDDLVGILRSVASGAYGSRKEAAQAIVKPTSGPPRSYVSRWRYFGHVIARERDQRRQEKAC